MGEGRLGECGGGRNAQVGAKSRLATAQLPPRTPCHRMGIVGGQCLFCGQSLRLCFDTPRTPCHRPAALRPSGGAPAPPPVPPCRLASLVTLPHCSPCCPVVALPHSRPPSWPLSPPCRPADRLAAAAAAPPLGAPWAVGLAARRPPAGVLLPSRGQRALPHAGQRALVVREGAPCSLLEG